MLSGPAAAASATGARPGLIPASPKDTLRYLATRVASPQGLLRRLQDATLVATVRLKRTTTSVHSIPDDPGVLHKLLPKPEPDVPPMLSLGVADFEVVDWISPDKGDPTLRLVWPMTGSTGAPAPQFTPKTTQLLIVPPQPSELLSKVRSLLEGVYLWTGGPNPVLDDLNGDVLAQALESPQSFQKTAKTRGLEALLWVEMQALAKDTKDAKARLERVIGDPAACKPLDWAARAALFKLGDQAAALQGLPKDAASGAELAAFGLTLLKDPKGDAWQLSGPAEGSPIAPASWSAKGACP